MQTETCLELFPKGEIKPSFNNDMPFKTQLLKWVGNKQRFAHEIISFFPEKYSTYFEPFVGSGAVLGTLAPIKGIAGDTLKPLVKLWQNVVSNPDKVNQWYRERYDLVCKFGKKSAYEKIKESYNDVPGPADFLFLTRTCYGGVMRFRQVDGYMSTPCGVHDPITPDSFRKRLEIWHYRLQNTTVFYADFEELFLMAKKGDVIYCDPPYLHSQSILYGAQQFSLDRLFAAIEQAKKKGVFVLLSIDGSKKSGKFKSNIDFPKGLFERIVHVNCGRSMLRRFQLKNKTTRQEDVTDRLCLTW